MKNLNVMDIFTAVILIVGGLNWGIYGFFGVNIIDSIFGVMSVVSRIIYILVGVSAVYVAMMTSNLEQKICSNAPNMQSIKQITH
jgi:uncharacterized membrane protein YuzA (DUF378 family)